MQERRGFRAPRRRPGRGGADRRHGGSETEPRSLSGDTGTTWPRGAAWAPTSPRTAQALRTTDGGDRKGRAHLAETRGRGDGEVGMRGAGGGRGRKDPEAEGHAECPRKVTTAPVADGPARAERAWGALGGQAAGAPPLQAASVRRHQASGWWVDTAPRVRLTGAGRAWGPLLRLRRVGETHEEAEDLDLGWGVTTPSVLVLLVR